MEGVLSTMQRKHENEVADLHATVDRLLKVDFLAQHVNYISSSCSSEGNRFYRMGMLFP